MHWQIEHNDVLHVLKTFNLKALNIYFAKTPPKPAQNVSVFSLNGQASLIQCKNLEVKN